MNGTPKKFRVPLIRKSDFYLLPNILTISRLFAVPLVAVFAYMQWNLTAGFLFGLAGLSDYVDGYIARKYKHESKLGMLLDPLCDKLIIVSTMIMLLWLGRLSFLEYYPVTQNWRWTEVIPPFLVVVTVGREIAITGLRAIASTAGMVMPAERGGKIKTWIQFFSIIFLLINIPSLLPTGQILLLLSVIAALWSGVQYVFKFLKRLPP